MDGRCYRKTDIVKDYELRNRKPASHGESLSDRLSSLLSYLDTNE